MIAPWWRPGTMRQPAARPGTGDRRFRRTAPACARRPRRRGAIGRLRTVDRRRARAAASRGQVPAARQSTEPHAAQPRFRVCCLGRASRRGGRARRDERRSRPDRGRPRLRCLSGRRRSPRARSPSRSRWKSSRGRRTLKRRRDLEALCETDRRQRRQGHWRAAARRLNSTRRTVEFAQERTAGVARTPAAERRRKEPVITSRSGRR